MSSMPCTRFLNLEIAGTAAPSRRILAASGPQRLAAIASAADRVQTEIYRIAVPLHPTISDPTHVAAVHLWRYLQCGARSYAS